MKKLFFTALAVLAFSGAGFAEGKKVRVKSKRCMDQVVLIINQMEANSGECFSSNLYNYFYGVGQTYCSSR